MANGAGVVLVFVAVAAAFLRSLIQMHPVLEPSFFDEIAQPILKRKNEAERSRDEQFASLFGTTLEVCCIIWSLVEWNGNEGDTEPVHLLWGLMLLKLYNSENALCSLAGGIDNKTLRKWAWAWIEQISMLESTVVSSVLKLWSISRTFYAFETDCVGESQDERHG